MTMPDPDSAKAAVETLRAELTMLDGALEATDRKAALVPVVVGTIAGIFIAPDTLFTPPQAFILGGALLSGIAATILAMRVLWAQNLDIGPNAQTTAANTHLTPAQFNRAVAGSTANSVDSMSELSKWKGRRLNRSMSLAALTILLLALARIAGGITMTDDARKQPPQTPSPTPQTTPPTTIVVPPLIIYPAGIPTDFGQQVAIKGGLPNDLATRIDDMTRKGTAEG